MNSTQVNCLKAIGIEVWLPIGAQPEQSTQSICYYCFIPHSEAKQPELIDLLDKILAALKWPREQVCIVESFDGQQAHAGVKVVLIFGSGFQELADKSKHVLLLPTLSELNASPALKKHVWSQMKPFIFKSS